ncbi:HTH domain-containing protein [Bacillota bacterium LX-D]|nr:HTH domain-containing protein [Bacillota bacterium LX-D]
MVVCAKCGQELALDDVYKVNGRDYCEDCAMSKQTVLKPCDTMAVHSATSTRKQLGLKGTEGLTPRQKAIYEFLKEKEGATVEEIMKKIGASETEIRKELAILRHCELGKAYKKGDQILFVPWDYKTED